jgi:glucokinase
VGDYCIGIDIGGTKIAAGLMDRAGNILAREESRCHTGCDPDEVVDVVIEISHALDAAVPEAGGPVVGLGVGCSGHVHSEKGIVLTNSNLPNWDRYPLRQTLQDRTGFPTWIDNDANCAALGEYHYGAGRGSRYMCYITFSTGCGMGILIDGKVYRGATGTAGEIGHTVVNPDGPLCSCGKRGCLMAYACGMALDQMARDCLECGEQTLIKRLCGDCPEHISAEMIAEAARQGDQVAVRLLDTAGRYFGIGLSTIVQVLNPDTIVVGGGLTHIGPLLLDPCIQALNRNIHPVLVDSARIVLSELWNDAGVLGAGSLVWEGCA